MNNALFFHLAALSGAAFLVADDSPLALWGVLATSICGVVIQILRGWQESRADARRHQFAKEDREFTLQARNEIRKDIAENTQLTVDAGEKADAAYTVANHVNEKIAALAQQTATTDRATAKASLDQLRSDIAENTKEARDRDHRKPMNVAVNTSVLVCATVDPAVQLPGVDHDPPV
jgi:hypothetical protein